MRLIETIKTLVEQCKLYDKNFDSKTNLYVGYSPFSLTMSLVPEQEMDEVAQEFGTKVNRLVQFGVGSETCPTVGPSMYFSIGSLSFSISSMYRKATIAEIDTAVAEIKKKVENCCKPEEHAPEVTNAGVADLVDAQP